MNTDQTYTLEEIAREFGLTPRTARHYIENVLPPHHKTGRGKLARYGQDTWNCFAFIQKARAEEKLTSAQISRVFADLNQEEINRVADGLEDLRFQLSERAGRRTLSAEDLLDFALDTESFTPVALFGIPHCENAVMYGEGVRDTLIACYRQPS